MSKTYLSLPADPTHTHAIEVERRITRELGVQKKPEQIAETLLKGCLELSGAPYGSIHLHRGGRLLTCAPGETSWTDLPESSFEATSKTMSAETVFAWRGSFGAGDALDPTEIKPWRLRAREQDVGTMFLPLATTQQCAIDNALDALSKHAGWLLVALHDVSLLRRLRRESKAVEAELQDMEAFVADAQSISRTGSWMWNPADPAIGEWSAETFKMLGYDPLETEASFENNFARVHPEDKDRYLAEVTAAAINEQDLDVQYQYLLPDGTVRQVHARGRRLSPTLYIGTANDITERRAAEAAIREAQIELASASRLSTLGELVTSISHELNQPLAAVVANAGAAKRWLDRKQPDLVNARDSIGSLVEDAKRAQEVIDSLRALARRSEPERRALDLNQAVIEISPLARSELRSRKTDLELDLDPLAPFLFADRVQVQQVVLTLLMTCLDQVGTADCGRAIKLRTALTEDDVVISVDGPCQIERHFLDRHVSPEDLIGHRLAMIVCRSIVEAHGGRLSLADGTMPNSLLEARFPRLEASSRQENRS